MPPLGYAVGLIDRYEAGWGCAQKVAQSGRGEPFGSGIENLQIALAGPPQNRFVLLVREGAVHERRGYAAYPESIDLILHQGDERRDHQRVPVHGQCGELVAEGLAPARWHEHQRVVARKHVGNNLFLQGEKSVKPEVGLEEGQDLGGSSHVEQLYPPIRIRKYRTDLTMADIGLLRQ